MAGNHQTWTATNVLVPCLLATAIAVATPAAADDVLHNANRCGTEQAAAALLSALNHMFSDYVESDPVVDVADVTTTLNDAEHVTCHLTVITARGMKSTGSLSFNATKNAAGVWMNKWERDATTKPALPF
jgi:hypothetical protein